MNNNTIMKVAATGFVALVVAPVVITTGIRLIAFTAAGISCAVDKVKFNRKIKKGLEDGSIVEIDGQYYEVEIKDVEEA